MRQDLTPYTLHLLAEIKHYPSKDIKPVYIILVPALVSIVEDVVSLKP